jgi:hypothetical protein
VQPAEEQDELLVQAQDFLCSQMGQDMASDGVQVMEEASEGL